MTFLARLLRSDRAGPPGDALYRAIVAEARTPDWYLTGSVPDTVDGRFDTVALVLALILIRLERDGEGARQFSADLTERFIADMDGSLRELGIGDPTVGKQVGHMVSALGGRLGAYRDALAGDADLDAALARNLYRGAAVDPAAVDWAARRVRALAARIAAVPATDLRGGTPVTPELSRFVRVSEVGTVPRRETIVATAAECAALARRFDLLALTRLAADLTVVAEAAGLRVTGTLRAAGEQACVVSAEPVAFTLDEDIDLRFSTAAASDADEVELAGTDLDVLPLDGDTLDLGEAVAQSLGLALDPYPRASDEVRAAAARYVISEAEAEAQRAADKAAASPFAALRAPR